jgi:hypothetical protein
MILSIKLSGSIIKQRRLSMRYGKKIIALVFTVLVSAASLFAQAFPRGAILDDDIYNSLPRKAEQLSRSYTAVPPAYSLKQYSPQPGNQGNYGTCTGWASAYAARTIAESIVQNRTDLYMVTNNVFSPVFVYKGSYSLKNINPTGQEGAVISDILEFMKREGPVKRQEFEKTTDFPHISLSMYSNTKRYPIGGYAILYVSLRGVTGDATRTEKVKKSISEGKPVIIGMNCPDSFFSAKDVWRPNESPAVNHGGHAMCVVGYDDAKYGGAFEIMNSWGTSWGNGGYIWIPYQVFNQFAYQAYEVIENLAAFKDGAEYAGSVKIEVQNSNQGMPVRFDNGYYRTTGSYRSRTRFRYLVGNTKPAYVYAFAGDDSATGTDQIFPPPANNISAVLDYSENTVAIPGETLWIQLDQRTGTDYLVVLYSKEPLDLNAIRNQFSAAKGTFPQRVAAAVGPDYMPAHQARYEAGGMRFSARSGNPKAVFALLLAIDHR